jgi:hypothetical protein
VGGGGVAGGFGAAGGFGGFGAAGGVGATTGAGGVPFDTDGVGAGWSAIAASTGPRTSVGASIDTADMAGSDPTVGPTGFTEQAANETDPDRRNQLSESRVLSIPAACGSGPQASDGCAGFARHSRD